MRSLRANSIGLREVARLLYAMGRIDVIPRTFGQTSSFDTPNALAPTVVAGTIVAVALGLGLGPFPAFIFLFALATVPLLLVYVATCLSVPRFYWRDHRDEFRIVRHVILPIAPIVVIAGVLYLQFVPLPAAPLNLVGPINAVWLVLGIAIVTMVGKRSPQALARASVVFGGEAGPQSSSQ